MPRWNNGSVALKVRNWDDAAGKKLNEETELFHVIQILESRISMSKEEVMIRAAESGALLIEKWMREEHEANGWFDDRSAGKTTQ